MFTAHVTHRYKNIPGWRALRDAFPAAKWYVSIDDDTYWLMDNFRRFIARFDPDVPQYLGNPHAFRPSRNLILGGSACHMSGLAVVAPPLWRCRDAEMPCFRC